MPSSQVRDFWNLWGLLCPVLLFTPGNLAWLAAARVAGKQRGACCISSSSCLILSFCVSSVLSLPEQLDRGNSQQRSCQCCRDNLQVRFTWWLSPARAVKLQAHSCVFLFRAALWFFSKGFYFFCKDLHCDSEVGQGLWNLSWRMPWLIMSVLFRTLSDLSEEKRKENKRDALSEAMEGPERLLGDETRSDRTLHLSYLQTDHHRATKPRFISTCRCTSNEMGRRQTRATRRRFRNLGGFRNLPWLQSMRARKRLRRHFTPLGLIDLETTIKTWEIQRFVGSETRPYPVLWVKMEQVMQKMQCSSEGIQSCHHLR